MTEEDEKRRRLIAKLAKCRSDFEAFSRFCVKIKSVEPGAPLMPLVLNRTQRFIHEKLEAQVAKGRPVRAMILKGRRQGVSTYVGARFYWRASMARNTNVFILAHKWDSTNTLFDMVDRMHRHNPFAPHVGASNAKELVFDRLDSNYAVGVASDTAEAGRGRLTSLFHGSEVAFWKSPEAQFAGPVQTVSAVPGTEIILESTANGASGRFYDMWQDAERGIGPYEAIFAPWFWEPVNSAFEVPDGFELSQEKDDTGVSETEYAEMYGLSSAQMLWRRDKIAELGPSKFRQEYPATSSEAFQNANPNSFIPAHLVLKARKNKEIKAAGPLIMGGDPAGAGGDRFAVAYRRGYVVEKVEWRDKVDEAAAVEWLARLIDDHSPAQFNIDSGGLGSAIVSMLRAKGEKYRRVVKPVNFGATSQAKKARPKAPGPKRRRDEMWSRSLDWLKLEEGVRLPDMDALQGDATGPMVKPSLTNDLELESKDSMRKRGVRSPDLWDAVALTFADLSHVREYSEEAKAKANPAREPDVAKGDIFSYEDDCLSEHGWMM